jgi:hypothetical protein
VVLASRAGHVRLIDGFEFKPQQFEGGRISLEVIEKAILFLALKYHARIEIDIWQASLLTERLRGQGVQAMASHLTSSFLWTCWERVEEALRAQALTWPASLPRLDVKMLGRELVSLQLEESPRSGALRVCDSDRKVHRDRSMSLALALNGLVESGHGFGGRLATWDRELGYSASHGKHDEVAWPREDLEPSFHEIERREIRNLERSYEEAAVRLLSR